MSPSRLRLLALAATLGLLPVACSNEEPVSTAGGPLPTARASTALEIRLLSGQPWLVTGGDALIELRYPASADPLQPTLRLDGQEINPRLVSVAPGVMQALVDDIPEGDVLLEASVPGGELQGSIELSNYPISGPIISGAHQSPFYCQTREFELVNGEPLGPEQDADCLVDSRVDYVYYSSEAQDFLPYERASDGSPPEDLAEIVDYTGATVPFIVRVETGVVNRAIYEIAMLHDPATGLVGPWRRSAGWNGKLVYTHGGGCRSGWHQQGDRTGGVMREGLFAQGYATVSASLNVFGQNCNDLLASETHIMVKERFIERYGVPEYTIATGASGGSYQSHQTADNYPGVFDGIIVAASFPDVTSATIFTVADARLLHHYFQQTNPEGFDREQQQAVAGFGSFGSLANLARGAARLDPLLTEGEPPEAQGGEFSLPALAEDRYSMANPDGLRATVYDHTRNVYGLLEGIGIAARPLDNVGVQYGLRALNSGDISVRQFLDLNRDIGGFDYDMHPVPERHQADPGARRAAIESGRILSGGAGLATTPVIDYRSYTDHAEGGDIHMIVHQFSTRQRLENANGHSGNHVMQVGGRWGFSEQEPDLGELFRLMDVWLMAIQADEAPDAAGVKVLRNRPEALTDACWDNRDNGHEKIEVEQTYIGDSPCNALYPAYSTPRHVAGAPLTNDIVSCHLRPVAREYYSVSFSETEWLELLEIFPDGVCDWSQGDVSDAAHQGVWASFGPSPVNRLYQ